MEQKKTWRLTFSDVWFSLMIFATCLSWLPRPEFGNVPTTGSTPRRGLDVEALLGDVARRLDERHARVEAAQRVERRPAGVVVHVSDRVAVQRENRVEGRRRGRHVERLHGLADVELVVARERQRRREGRPRVQAREASAVRPPQPSFVTTSDAARHPRGLLVAVREELVGTVGRVRAVERLRRRPARERADVRDDRELALVEQRLQLRHRGMDAEVEPHARERGREGGGPERRNRERSAARAARTGCSPRGLRP